MAQYFTDFTEYAADEDVTTADWTDRWGDPWDTHHVRDVSGDIFLELEKDSNGRSLLTWDEIDADADRDDIEIYMDVEVAGGAGGADQRYFRVVGRGSGGSTTEQGYVGGPQATSRHGIGKYDAGSFTLINSADAQLAQVRTCVRLRINGTTIEQKTWEQANEEPGTWALSETDSDISGVGWAGIFQFEGLDSGLTWRVRAFGVGTNGDAAPTEPVVDDTGPFLLPEILTSLPLDPNEQDPGEQSGEIRIPPPAGEGTLGTQESTLILIASRSPIPHANMTTVPTGAVHLAEGGDLTDANRPFGTIYRMPPGHIQTGNYVFENSHAVSSGQRTLAVAVRVRNLHPTSPVSGTVQVHVQEGTEGGDDDLGDPDGIVRFDAFTPDHVPTLLINLGATRRNGLWTKDAELSVIFRDPAQLEPADHAAYWESHDEAAAPETPTEAPQREAFHDNPLDPFDTTPQFYRRVGVRAALRGATDEELPGMPDHTGTEAVSWGAVKLVATDVPGAVATDDIKVYRHTASMAGDPVANGTLVHTFSPDGTAVDADGWSADTEYFVQMVATNANGSTLGLEFTVKTWAQAAYVLTDAQTMEIPMKVHSSGVTIEKKELKGSNEGLSSWAYDHPADADYLLVIVSAFDGEELAVVSGVTYDGVAMTNPRTDESDPSSSGGYMLGGIFEMADGAAPSGSHTLAVSFSGGGTPVDVRAHVFSLSGSEMSMRSALFAGSDTLFTDAGVSLGVVSGEGDRVFDYVAWRNSAVDVASIGDGQTQELGDDSPTRQNSTSKVAVDTSTLMEQTADADSPTNVCIYYGISIRSQGGAPAMKSLEIDVGKAALNDSDLTTTPSLDVEIFDSGAALVGSGTLDGLSLIEGGVQEIIATSDIMSPQEIEIHLTNSGRTVAVWLLLGSEEAVAAPTLVSATTNEARTQVLLTFDRAMASPVGEHGAFSWREDAVVRAFSAAALDSGDASIIVLTIDGDPAELGAALDVSYAPGTVESADGVALEAITQRPFLPVLVSAATSSEGTLIRATFDKAMADPAGEHGAFSFDEDGTGRTFSAAALDGGDATVIVLTVDGAAIDPAAALTLSYTPGTVEAADGEALAAFADEPVTNATPVVISAFTNDDGTTVTYRHDQAMADPTGEHGSYSFREDAGAARGYTAAALGADPRDIVLTVDGAAITAGATLDGSYTPGTVQSAEGEALAAFSDEPIANQVESDLAITSWLLPTAVRGESYDHVLEVEGGTPPYSWDVTLGGFPTGISLHLATGTYSGTVDASATTKSATLRVTDDVGAQAIREFTIEVVDATAPLAADIVGPTSGIIDVAAADLEDGVTLPMVALQAAFDTDPLALSVEAIPYSGWDGTNVQGYAGPSVFASSRDVLIEYAEVIPASAFGGSPGELHPSAAGTTEQYEAPVQGIPVGALITEFTSVMARANADDIAEAKLVDPIYLSPYGWTEFAGWDNTHDVDAEDYTTETDEKAIEVTGGKPLTVRVRLRGDASSSDAALAYIRIKYQLRVGA